MTRPPKGTKRRTYRPRHARVEGCEGSRQRHAVALGLLSATLELDELVRRERRQVERVDAAPARRLVHRPELQGGASGLCPVNPDRDKEGRTHDALAPRRAKASPLAAAAQELARLVAHEARLDRGRRRGSAHSGAKASERVAKGVRRQERGESESENESGRRRRAAAEEVRALRGESVARRQPLADGQRAASSSRLGEVVEVIEGSEPTGRVERVRSLRRLRTTATTTRRTRRQLSRVEHDERVSAKCECDVWHRGSRAKMERKNYKTSAKGRRRRRKNAQPDPPTTAAATPTIHASRSPSP